MDVKGDTQISRSPIADDQPETLNSAECRPAYLIVVEGGTPGMMFHLSESGARLGRSAESTVQFVEDTVSRQHAAFSIDLNGHIGLTDLGSLNGTFLNGQRVQPDSPVWIRDGDRIQLGSSVVLKFVRLDPQDERFQRVLFERMVRDPLTGLFNRGYFLDQIGSLVARNGGAEAGLAMMLLDIDHFKRINDSHGHDAGDFVLAEVARRLRESTRPDDLVARYGGEEFIVSTLR